MGYGDAFVYTLIISDDTVTKVNRIRAEIKAKRQEIEAIVNDYHNGKKVDQKQREYHLKLIDENQCRYLDIIKACASPIAMYHVATDDWLEAWETCSKFNFRPVQVKVFLDGVKGKLWSGEDLEKHSEAWCICLPSHYDTDDEFLDELNVEYYRRPEGGSEYRTKQK